MKTVFYHFRNIDSTNSFIKKNPTLVSPGSLVICSAQNQTQGRGQYGRTWQSSEDNLLASFGFLTSPLKVNFTLLVAEIIQQILDSYHIKASIKLPNDLFVQEAKICGILTETTPVKNQLLYIIGIGLNVNSNEEFLKKIDQKATSMFAQTHQTYDISSLLKQISSLFLDQLIAQLNKE